ncbi:MULTISPECIES: 2-keto-4-pentenoate hydratase [unclassified Sinorhizobium]|uniref:2-keto-4-pentenoate hydratase n=1 Tax=unclassified Sinorhizobium TaxID=2613772 RepID=UPI0035241D7F
MYFELIDSTAETLAKSRKRETSCDLALDRISSGSEALEIQTAALDALGFERNGYTVVGSSEASRRMLRLTNPVYSSVPSNSYYTSRSELRLPPGMIGAQCELAFTMLRRFPDEGEDITFDNAALAVLGCQPALGLLGRRTKRAYGGDFAATADFGFHVATVCGSYADVRDFRGLDEVEVNAFLFKRTVVSGSATCIFGHPLEAIVWLAKKLAGDGRQLHAGEIVTTGSCTTILEVMPGQHLAAEFGRLGQVECFFA